MRQYKHQHQTTPVVGNNDLATGTPAWKKVVTIPMEAQLKLRSLHICTFYAMECSYFTLVT
jgi:hypothetical protein